MKFKKYFFAIIFLISILFVSFNTFSYASSSDLELKNLEYKVDLNSDGTANVTEIWDISIEDTNTLFKTFEIDNSKYSGITNVSLIETTKGINKPFSQIYQEKYHVDKDCYYGLINSKNQFEIAWGVHEDTSYARRTFEISYTIIDAVKNYNDCSEFYWQFISTSSAIPAKKITGTITLPTEVINIDDLRIWAHGPLNGNINKIDASTINFDVTNLNKKTMLEARVVTPTYVFDDNLNTLNESKLDSILSQETKWANEANAQREFEAHKKEIVKTIFIIVLIIVNILGILLAIYLIKKIKKYSKELKEAPNYVPTMPSKYYRDIPNTNSSPAQAAFLYYFKTSNISVHVGDIVSATILNLCMKKFLTFEVLADTKNNVKLILKTDMDESNLTESEKLIFDLLKKVNSSNEFTMKEFEKYCKRNSTSCSSKFTSIAEKAKNEAVLEKNYDKNLATKYSNWSTKGVLFIFLAIFTPFMIVSVIPSLICGIYALRISGKYNTLTQKGLNEQEAWKGLKNYMSDFSMMNEKELPELILWEKYLVFATAFGISDKVLKQLKISYPQLNDRDYMFNNGYTYLYLMHHSNFSNNFIHTINTSVTNTYNSINYSSGSGSGGGFSSGGGFGGGGGRNGRKIIY